MQCQNRLFFIFLEDFCFLPEKDGIWEYSRMPRQADIAGCLLFAGFQGKKDNIVYFSAGFEVFKYTSQRFGFFTMTVFIVYRFT